MSLHVKYDVQAQKHAGNVGQTAPSGKIAHPTFPAHKPAIGKFPQEVDDPVSCRIRSQAKKPSLARSSNLSNRRGPLSLPI
jgi:hypothetical protein